MYNNKSNKKHKAYSYLRFSTPDQLKGDSFRRQVESSRLYAEKHGLDLDDALTFQDLGISAFRGKNIEEGALKAFIEAVDSGQISSGSYLLVESLDRLSRQNVWNALQQFTAILNRRINIVTLQDEKIYSSEQGEMAFSDIMVSLVAMQRAYEESLIKSKRLSEAWSAKRAKAQLGNLKLTARCPAWLKLEKDKGSFKVIDERGDVIKKIFQKTLDGIGKRTIARQFNTEKVSTFGRSRGWQPSYIQKILENEAVIGIFQPHKINIVNGKKRRVPQDEPIEGYFPKIVDVETFFKAKRMRTQRRIPSGKAGKGFSNLFTGLAICGSCGAPMHYENKGRGPKGGTYLVCADARNKVGNCLRHSWKYPQTQAHIILNLMELDFREIFPNLYERSQTVISHLEDAILVKEAELNKTEKALERLADLLIQREDSSTLLNKLDLLEAQKAQLETELAVLNTSLASERERIEGAGQQFDDIDDAMGKYIETERFGDDNPMAILDARRRLHQLLMQVIDQIIFYPASNDTNLHGTLEIKFQGVGDYFRKIQVEKGQKDSLGYKVTEEGESLHVAVPDAQWPPADRILSGQAMEQMILGSN